MTAARTVEWRQAPGWWPSLVIGTCTRCHAESGVVNLNDSTQVTYTGRPRWEITHTCEGDR